MARTLASCCFHGVGQGLFYSTILRREREAVFSFVYDCGSRYIRNRDSLRCEMDKLLKRLPKDGTDREGNPCPRLHVLFVSHLDDDHINGIPYLMEHCAVDMVVLPYTLVEERMLRLLGSRVEEGDPLYDLYVDPVGYFSHPDRGVSRIFLVHPTSPEDAPPDLDLDDPEGPEGPQDDGIDRPGLDGFLDDRAGLGFSYRRHGPSERSGGAEVVHVSGLLGMESWRCHWKIAVYHDRCATVGEDICRELRDLLNIKSVDVDEEWKGKLKIDFSNRDLVKKIKDIYIKYLRSSNQSSIVLYHGPDKQKGKSPHTKWELELCVECDWYWTHGYRQNTDQIGTLLTGDINLNRLEDAGAGLRQFVRRQPVPPGMILVPHHGSRHNTSVSLLKSISDYGCAFACSYGLTNQYHHPHAYTLDEILAQIHGPILHVVEERSVVYYIEEVEREV